MLVIWLLSLNTWLICNLFLDCLDYLYLKSFGDFNSAFHLGQGKGWACGKYEYRNLQISQALWNTAPDAPRNPTIQKLLLGFRDLLLQAAVGIYRCHVSVPGKAATLCLPGKRNTRYAFWQDQEVEEDFLVKSQFQHQKSVVKQQTTASLQTRVFA